MNFLQKIDNYLLINYPVLWRTKVHYLVLFFLIANAIGFVLAYGFDPMFYRNYEASIPWTAGCQLLIFLLWLVSQARMKISTYDFQAQVLTFLTYIACVWLLMYSFNVYYKTAESRIETLFGRNIITTHQEYTSKESCMRIAFEKEKISKGLINNKTLYLRCRLFKFCVFIILTLFLFLVSHVNFRMWLLLVFPYFVLIFLLLYKHEYAFLTDVGSTIPPVEIVLIACLRSVFAIKNNTKLRQFLVFFIIAWTPIITLLLILRFVSFMNITPNAIEYVVKATMTLLLLTTTLSTYLITKKNIMPA